MFPAGGCPCTARFKRRLDGSIDMRLITGREMAEKMRMLMRWVDGYFFVGINLFAPDIHWNITLSSFKSLDSILQLSSVFAAGSVATHRLVLRHWERKICVIHNLDCLSLIFTVKVKWSLLPSGDNSCEIGCYQGSTTNQTTVNIRLCEQACSIRWFGTTTIQYSSSLSNCLSVFLCKQLTDSSMYLLCLLV